MGKGIILYVGGFQLPDKNAAALRVIANAKALRELGYQVIFVNALVDTEIQKPRRIRYEGFECYEYPRERQKEYLFSGKRIISVLKKTGADMLFAYNHPAVALNKLRKYCEKYGIRCYADATEWYAPVGNPVFRIVKGFDTELRMRYVQPKLDGVIAISEYLYQYYKHKVKTVKIPPLVDLEEDKWKVEVRAGHDGIKLIYAGSPSVQKERLNLMVVAVESAEDGLGLHLDVIGMTKEQYNSMYGCGYAGDKVTFWGRVPNSQVIKMTKESDWTVILREKNKAVQAGFPTKVPESISCGTPVIANRFSNIEEYLDESNSILIDKAEDIHTALISAGDRKDKHINQNLFDFREFTDLFQTLIEAQEQIL